jgi:UDP-glucose 4-epimerase
LGGKKRHLKALNSIEKQPGLVIANLGTDHGYSVLEIIDAFEKVLGRTVQYEIVNRRSRDVVQCYTDPSYTLEKLEWRTM